MQRLSPTQLAFPAADLQAHSKIRLEVFAAQEDLYRQFARQIADEIKTNNAAGRPTRLILPVGPVAQYPRLAEICNQERISWARVFTFNMDEYCDWQGRWLPSTDPLSFRGYMERFFALLEPGLRIPAHQVHFPDPLDLDGISARIQELGGIDTCYGGVGYHGHVAFNEPAVSRWYPITVQQLRRSLTRLVPIEAETIVMNSIRATGGNPTNFPPMGVTLGMADILAARHIRLYCPGGAWQRYALRVACLGEVDADYPVTLLQEHPDAILYADRETAAPPLPSLDG